VTTSIGTTATVHGLSAADAHTFTVVARDTKGRTSAPSKAVQITTPASDGPTAYEAEAPGNTLTGNAAVAGCDGCSGGQKIGNLGGGEVAITHVSAPNDGTYLMKLDYVDGDSSRVIDLTVGDTTLQIPVPGTNDNNWGAPQSLTVPVALKAGDNTLTFGNATDYAPDIDKITV
jgi:hypothetical protein